MSTTRFRSALLFICSSLAAVAVLAGEPAQPSAAEIELGLARLPRLYLVIDLNVPSLEVKARGIVLDRTVLEGAALSVLQPMVGSPSWPRFEPPILWWPKEPPEANWRRLVAPAELRQYSDSTADAEAQQPIPVEPAPEAPSRYSIDVDTGWQLVISDQQPNGLWRRLASSAADSWRRWAGRPQPPAPPRLVLSMSADDSRRLLHVFQREIAILVVAPPAEVSAAGNTL